jgi:hypothetical protein
MATALQELRVLLEYLVKHNQDHATELMDLAGRVKAEGHERAYDHMVKGADLLDESNRALREALEELEG